MDLTSSNYDNFMAAATFHPLGALSDPDRKVFIKRRSTAKGSLPVAPCLRPDDICRYK